ncbi:MAG: hypothetical protein KBC73_21630 [Burkholderiaceae bacterium]|nr:hypothetical protein [Burkholderiaceae bacterium]
MKDLMRPAWALLGVAALSGCAMTAPNYSPSIDNLEILKRSAAPMALGAFTLQSGLAGGTSIGLRGNSMNSSVGGDYAAYLAEALRQELALAGKLDPKSRIVISGLLLKNDIAAAGMATNSGEIEARFSVSRDGQPRYAKAHRVEMSWESSFAGAVAIPKAMQQYPLMVQKLIGQLLADPEFIAALK